MRNFDSTSQRRRTRGNSPIRDAAAGSASKRYAAARATAASTAAHSWYLPLRLHSSWTCVQCAMPLRMVVSQGPHRSAPGTVCPESTFLAVKCTILPFVQAMMQFWPCLLSTLLVHVSIFGRRGRVVALQSSGLSEISPDVSITPFTHYAFTLYFCCRCGVAVGLRFFYG